MTKQVIIFTWEGKRLGYSKLEGETEWTMDMPESPRAVSKMMKLTASDESIKKMAKDMEVNGGEVRRFELEEENS